MPEDHDRFVREEGAGCTVLLKKDGSFPLKEAGRIALYGNGARHTVKGGTGSGEVNSRSFVNIEDGLKAAGFSITTNAWLDAFDKIRAKADKDFLKSIRAEARAQMKPAIMLAFGRIPPEPEYGLPLTDEGDTAIYVLSRISGEGADRSPSKGDIFLTDSEKRDILELNARYPAFMLVLNTGGPVDLTPVKDVKNILILSQLGTVTGHILADILLGKSSPSGKLTTTWTSWEDYPMKEEFGGINETLYKEGIYVGYRYFRTTGSKPLFPFGFGLSYTLFGHQAKSFELKESDVKVTAEVKNEGSHKGRETLQLYVSKPEGKLDQPAVELCAFSKTSDLEPGSSTGLDLSCSMKDLASYDESREIYILEPGDYLFFLGNSSDDIRHVGTVRISEEITTRKAKNFSGKANFEDFRPENRSRIEGSADVPVFTLDPKTIVTDIPDYDAQETIDPIASKMTDDELILMNIGSFRTHGSLIGMVGDSGFSVAGAAGETYMGADRYGIPSLVMADGPAGLRLAPEYYVDKKGIPHAAASTLPSTMLPFLPKIALLPLKIRGLLCGKKSKREQYATAIPIGTAVAQSFDTGFAYKLGDIVGDEMERFGVHLWLAPALNIHRNIRCGRNFEYYSEDPLISGEFAAAITRGVQAHKGCGTVIKHYAANNQEFNRTGNNSCLSGRAFREIYLRGFEIAIRRSSPLSVMTSYNLINGVHTSEHEGLIGGILRSELDYKGIVMTDWWIRGNSNVKGSVYPISNAPAVLKAGGNLFMPGDAADVKEVKKALEEGKLTRKDLERNAGPVITLTRRFSS